MAADFRSDAVGPLTLARRADVDEIADMSRDLIEDGLQWAWTPQRVAGSVRRHDALVVVARVDARIIGFAIMRYGADDGHLDLLAVQPDHRHHGLGRRLVEWLEKPALVAGIRSVFLEVRESNTGARAFYERLGYRQRDRLPGYYQDLESAIRMGREIGVPGPPLPPFHTQFGADYCRVDALNRVDDLAARFAAQAIPHAEWTHHAHLTVGMWQVQHFGPDEALTRLRAGIRALNDAHGTPNSPTRGYHETITRAYVRVLADFLAGCPIEQPLAQRIARLLASPLAAPDFLLRFYSRARLMSETARASWLDPDIAAISIE